MLLFDKLLGLFKNEWKFPYCSVHFHFIFLFILVLIASHYHGSFHFLSLGYHLTTAQIYLLSINLATCAA